MADETGNDLWGALTALAAVGTLPVGILTALFVGWEASVVVFVVGWLLLAPTIPIVGGFLDSGTDESAEGDEQTDPLTELKQRYARGELGDEEFERRVGNLIETEDVEVDTDVSFDRESNAERIRE